MESGLPEGMQDLGSAWKDAGETLGSMVVDVGVAAGELLSLTRDSGRAMGV